MAIISRPFLTIDEVADLIRVNRAWVLRAIHQGTLGHFVIANRPRITPEQLFDWLRMKEKPPTYNPRELSVLGREDVWELTDDGWQWRRQAEQLRDGVSRE